MFGQLDAVDLEAMREGFAITRLQKHFTREKKIGKKESILGRSKKKIKEPEEVDILRILNIIQGKPYGDSPQSTVGAQE